MSDQTKHNGQAANQQLLSPEQLAELRAGNIKTASMTGLIAELVAHIDAQQARIADLELALFAENQKRQVVEQQRGQALAALKAITYEIGGRYFVGRHGDTDVTDEVAAAIAAAELFGNSEQLPDSTTTQPSGNSGELPTTAQPAVALDGWTPIDSAPQDGRTMLLGYFNSHGKWRTMRGQWFAKEYIDDNWEDGDLFEAGWYETSVEADDAPNCWPTKPTHWMPTPTAPKPHA